MMQNVGCSETPHFRTSLTKISWISFFCWMRKIVWRRRSLVQTEHPALRYARYLFYRRECLLHGGSTFSLRLKQSYKAHFKKIRDAMSKRFHCTGLMLVWIIFSTPRSVSVKPEFSVDVWKMELGRCSWSYEYNRETGIAVSPVY